MKKYKVWIEDNMEPELGFWWYCYLDKNGYLQDMERKDEMPDSLEWHLKHGYKVVEL